MLSRRETLFATILSPLSRFVNLDQQKKVTKPSTLRDRIAAVHKLFETNKAILHLKLTDGTERFYKSEIKEDDTKITISMENLDGTMTVQESNILNTDLEIIAKCNTHTIPMCHGDKLFLNYTITFG